MLTGEVYPTAAAEAAARRPVRAGPRAGGGSLHPSVSTATRRPAVSPDRNRPGGARTSRTGRSLTVPTAKAPADEVPKSRRTKRRRQRCPRHGPRGSRATADRAAGRFAYLLPMRLVCVSDTHEQGRHVVVPDGDVLCARQHGVPGTLEPISGSRARSRPPPPHSRRRDPVGSSPRRTRPAPCTGHQPSPGQSREPRWVALSPGSVGSQLGH